MMPEPCRYCGETDCPTPSDCPVRRQHMAEDTEAERKEHQRLVEVIPDPSGLIEAMRHMR